MKELSASGMRSIIGYLVPGGQLWNKNYGQATQKRQYTNSLDFSIYHDENF